MKYPKITIWATLLVIILLISLFLRFTNLGWETLEYDEVPILYAGQEFLKGNFLTFFAFDQPPMMKYFDVLALSLFGFSEVAIRLLPAIFGFGMVLLTYFFVKKLYKNERLAVLSTVFVAFSIIHLIMSRYAEIPIVMGFFYLLSLYFLFVYIENKNKRSAVYLGIALGIGMVSKYLMIYAMITVIVYAIIKKLITLRLRPQISLSLDRGIIKALIIGLVVFLLLWPTFLLPLRVDMDITIEGSRQRNVSVEVPSGLLSFGDVASYGVLGDRKDLGSRSLPFIGSMIIFAVKESAIFIILFIVGLYFVIKKPEKVDKLVITALIIFLLFLWLQNWGYTYRHLPPIIPLIAIISSRWILEIKRGGIALVAIALISVVLAATAISAYPDYPLHYNQLNYFANVTGLETHLSEGLRETRDYVAENCTRVLTDRANRYMLEFYFEPGFVSYTNQSLPTCIVVASTYYADADTMNNVMANAKCDLGKEIYVKSQKLVKIYNCS